MATVKTSNEPETIAAEANGAGDAVGERGRQAGHQRPHVHGHGL